MMRQKILLAYEDIYLMMYYSPFPKTGIIFNNTIIPHFYAVSQYDEDVIAKIDIEKCSVASLDAEFPTAKIPEILNWCRTHKDKLLYNWELLKQNKPLMSVPPLDYNED